MGADTAVRAGTAGTSDDSRDAWFVGYTKSLACAVWCGRDDSVGLPGGGKEVAAPLWAKFMRAASAGGASGERSLGWEGLGGRGGGWRSGVAWRWRDVAVISVERRGLTDLTNACVLFHMMGPGVLR